MSRILEAATCLTHLAVLFASAYALARRLFSSRGDILAATVLATWANIVGTGAVLGAVGALRSRFGYFALSLILAALPGLFCRIRGVRPWSSPPAEREWPCDRRCRLATIALASLWAVAAIASVVVVLRFETNNWDTLVYRFPRALFYLGEGSLASFPTADSRLVWSPLAAPLLYLFLAQHGLVGISWMLVSFANWLLQAFAIAWAARRFGASVFAAVGAAWCGVLAPSLLVQAASGNDDSLAATPLLLGAVFLRAWWREPRLRLLALAAVGAGLSFGTKLHAVFYWPLALALPLLFWRRRRLRSTAAGPAHFGLRARQTAVVLPFVAALATGHLVAGAISSGTFRDPATKIVLHDFRDARAPLQTLALHSLNLAVRTVADLPVLPDSDRRANYYERWRSWLRDSLLRDFKPAPGFAHPGDPWRPELLESDRFYYEHSVSPGLLPFVLLAALPMFAAAGRRPPAWCVGLALSFLAWHVGFALLYRMVYIPPGTYYAYPLLLMAPATGWLWDRLRGESQRRRRLAVALLVVVAGSEMLAATNVLLFNSRRSVEALRASGGNPPRITSSPDFERFVRSAPSLYVPYTYWAMEHWRYMQMSPRTRFRTGIDRTARPPSTDLLLLLHRWPQVGGAEQASVPIRVPTAAAGSYVYIGDAFEGSVQGFARGATATRLFPERAGYVVCHVRLERTGARSTLTGVELTACDGEDAARPVDARIAFGASAGGLALVSDWLPIRDLQRRYTLPAKAAVDRLLVATRLADDPGHVVENLRVLAFGESTDWSEFRTLTNHESLAFPSTRRTEDR